MIAFVLIVQIGPGMILALIWIIPSPHQFIGGGFLTPYPDATPAWANKRIRLRLYQNTTNDDV